MNEFGEEARFITQSFRISRDTNFQHLLEAASKYWGVGRGFKFEIEEGNQATKVKPDPEVPVEKFFEKNREAFNESKAVLIMKRSGAVLTDVNENTKKTPEELNALRARKKLLKAKNVNKKEKKNKPEQEILERLPGLKPFYNLAEAKRLRE